MLVPSFVISVRGAVGNDEYALLQNGQWFPKRSIRFVNICEMRCQFMMTYLMMIEILR